MPFSSSHLVLIPSYNTGPKLLQTVEEALRQWQPVWVVIDGSDDGSEAAVIKAAETRDNLRVIVRPVNGGKGAAVLTGIEKALAAGFTHVLTMDADGQHPADHIGFFMAASAANPSALILGKPVFGPEVPLERLHGRKLSVGLVHLATLSKAVGDPLFGFRVYPAAPLKAVLGQTLGARGFDFDPEVAVRLVWAGLPTLNLPAPCRYFSRAQGGISHFHYFRDNAKMVWLHSRIFFQLLLWRWPSVWLRSRQHRRRTAVSH